MGSGIRSHDRRLPLDNSLRKLSLRSLITWAENLGEIGGSTAKVDTFNATKPQPIIANTAAPITPAQHHSNPRHRAQLQLIVRQSRRRWPTTIFCQASVSHHDHHALEFFSPFPSNHWHEYRNLSDQWQQAIIARVVVPRSFLVSLVSLFEYFLDVIFQFIFVAKPELLDIADRRRLWSPCAP